MIERLAGAAAVARADAIAAILSEAHASPEERWPPDSVAATLGTPGTMAVVAAGGCAVMRVAGDEAELLTLAVATAARGQGLGAGLLAACIEGAAQAGAARLHLEVGSSNAPALALYAGAGFAPAGRRPGYYRRAAGREDAVLMARDLP